MRPWLKSNRGFLIFLLCFGFFRTAVADWNPIPSGSMRPTLLEGDVVFVNRLAYDAKLPLTDIAVLALGEPARGDVVTFSSPRDGTRLIKRIVAIPGDTVELRDGVLWLNGVAAQYREQAAGLEALAYFGSTPSLQAIESVAGSERQVQSLPAVRARRDFGPVTVPKDSYFMLGDNRDNSEDSRFIGVVPRHLLIGRAVRLLVSADIQGDWMPRLERVGKSIN
ncbi:signal peptidase I [Caldimonas brevitalea]|uniref:Signal peptidase I n=1 Tax=Caldimonas brevitalea TaxID=413882 RepID=A0A0G3BL76_9BURK|nr:signal peptidase I [Caldimonas brevitalea]AKJ30214.1 signal peptidase [Caldimonas brevitalea]